MLNLLLDGAWNLQQADQSGDVVAAAVPGCVHTDLLRAGLIKDPFWRDNETGLQWVGKTPWTYSRIVKISAEFFAQKKIFLRAEGLDTLAEVCLNDQSVGTADNQHITWEWNVKSVLREGENHLEIRFTPPDVFLQEHGKIDPLPAWNEYGGYQHRGWLRKAHSNFGWDWGPVIVSCGIWRSISLLAYSHARLENVIISQEHLADGAVDLGLEIELQNAQLGAYQAECELSFEGLVVANSQIALGESASRKTAVLHISQPQLWWPNGLGNQPLYTLSVRLLGAVGNALDEWKCRIGLRRLELARRPDTWGESFQFECNSLPFFAKGCNWAPPLPYPVWPEGDGWKNLLRDAAAVHMNMIRVWGGAYFPPDEFFDLCDELGLTVWQDFLFACGPYPAFDPDFLNSVEREARDNVRRLRHHACLALWCGNNEVEPTFVGPNREAAKEGQMSVADYDKIFHDLLPRIVHELSPQIAYWPASPSHPTRDRADFHWPFSPDAGDTHIWEIWFSDSPFENYRRYANRFISEFGFQSFPHPKTIASYTLPDERQINSPVMEFHQRSAPGNKQMLKFILEWFRFPEKRDDLIQLTQLIQALAVKTGVEHWRRNMPQTMGTLYWQLNDTWPCPSWSSIDFFGRWKALHHFAAHFFAPVLVSAVENSEAGTVETHLTNDLRHAVQGEVRCRATDLDGRLLKEENWPIAVAAGTSAVAGVFNLELELKDHGNANVLVWLDFLEKDQANPVSPRNLVLFTRPKSLDLRSPGLWFEVSPEGDDSFIVTVRTKNPALWVWLETTEFDTRFADNYRCLHPDDTWCILAMPERRMTGKEFLRHLVIRDLHGTYAESLQPPLR